MAYLRRKIIYEEVAVLESELVGVTEAARITGLSKPGIISAIERGTLTEIINQSASNHIGRRMLLKSELMNYKNRLKS